LYQTTNNTRQEADTPSPDVIRTRTPSQWASADPMP